MRISTNEKDGKQQLFFGESGVNPDFGGTTTNQFAPDQLAEVDQFDSTAIEFLDLSDLAGWEVGECLNGHTVITLRDQDDRIFAHCHIGDEEDVDRLIFSLLAGDCPHPQPETYEAVAAQKTITPNAIKKLVAKAWSVRQIMWPNKQNGILLEVGGNGYYLAMPGFACA